MTGHTNPTNNTALRYARILLERYNGNRNTNKLPYRFEG